MRYIFQRINSDVFRDVPALMDNITRTICHVRGKLEAEGVKDISRRTLTLVPTMDNRQYLVDETGCYWRAYIFIERARTYDVIQNSRQAFEAAKAFGRFQRYLTDLPAPRLNETIPAFHQTRSRFDAFANALDADCCNRADKARDEIAFALQREAMVDVLVDLQAEGELPERVTHNDTKLNNVMIDDDTSEGVCVIDLDTVMPGLALYDFGDMVRTATNTGAEDEIQLSRICCDLDIFDAIVSGYLLSVGDTLQTGEIELLAFSGRLITFETGLRFLTDYLSGDTYFKTHREGHNLDRCRTQFKLVSDMEAKEVEMVARVRKHAG